jgi:hypothetical protein
MAEDSLSPCVPERIIICLDLTEESNGHDFSKTKKGATRFDVIKNCLRIWVVTKSKINNKHEFAICILGDVCIWYQDFTANADQIINIINKLECQGKSDKFDMSTIFSTINEKAPDILHPRSSQPPFIYRALLVYCRSTVIPQFLTGKELAQQMLDTRAFFFDGMYLHSKPSKENKPQEVYDAITELESDATSKTAYFFENSTNIKRFHLNMAQMIAHPLQRPDQGDFKPLVLGKDDKKNNKS